jgi:hypothetical protein
MSSQKTLDDIYNFLDEHWQKINKYAPELERYFAQKREVAETETSRDLQKSVQHLLADIHDESLDDQSRSRSMTVARTMARFASLLSVLSVQADFQTQRIIRLTRWVIGLTWTLVALTLVLLFLTAYLSYDVYLKSKANAAPRAPIEQSEKPAPPE